MSRKAILIAISIVVALALIGGAVIYMGDNNESSFARDEFSTVEPELESETAAGEGESAEDADLSEDEGDNAQGADGSVGSNDAGGSSAGSGNAPADDGSTTQGVTYSQYNAMSAEEQQAWFNSFESVEAFFEWYNNAKAVYEANDDSIIIDGNTSIDMGEIAKKQS